MKRRTFGKKKKKKGDTSISLQRIYMKKEIYEKIIISA